MSLTATRPDAPPVPAPRTVPAGSPDLATRARADGIEFLMALFVDLVGKPCAKLVPIEAVDELQTEGVGFAGYAAGAHGAEPQDPDLIAVPDLGVLHAGAVHQARAWRSCTATRTSTASRGRSPPG